MLLGFDFWPNSLESMFCCGICKKILKISTPTSLSGRPVHHFYGSCDLNFVRLHSHKSDGLGGEFHPPKPPKTSKTTSKNHHLTTLHQAPNHHPTSTTPPKNFNIFEQNPFLTMKIPKAHLCISMILRLGLAIDILQQKKTRVSSSKHW